MFNFAVDEADFLVKSVQGLSKTTENLEMTLLARCNTATAAPVEGGGAGVAVAALAAWLRACARALAAPKPICLK